MRVQAFAPTSITVVAALWIGKPMGLLVGATIALRLFGFRLPDALRTSDLVLVALISAMGFTIPVLAIGTALPGGGMEEAARLGLALSLVIGFAAIVIARLRRRR
jgi:NhaA family Na+:H+ antiporter